jgi:hypothetical protein
MHDTNINQESTAVVRRRFISSIEFHNASLTWEVMPALTKLFEKWLFGSAEGAERPAPLQSCSVL